MDTSRRDERLKLLKIEIWFSMLTIRFGSPLISFRRLIKLVSVHGGGLGILGGGGVSTQEVGTYKGSVFSWWVPRGVWVPGVSIQRGWVPRGEHWGDYHGWVPKVGEYPGERVNSQGSEWVPRGWVLSGMCIPGDDTHPCYSHLVAATKTCTVGKRGVCILLECFVLFCIFICQNKLKYLKSEQYADKKYYHFGKENVLQEKNEKWLWWRG